MSGRTYTYDADLMDRIVARFAPDSTDDFGAFVAATKAQQPKSRIPWKQGLRLHRKTSEDVIMLSDEKPVALVIRGPRECDVGILYTKDFPLPRFDGETFDPEFWEVVE